MNLDALMEQEWNKRGASTRGAMSAILDHYGGSLPDFYLSGKKHVEDMFYALSVFGVEGPEPNESPIVEIGCGMGRLTIWLANYFPLVHATDVSRSMVERVPRVPNVRTYAVPSLVPLFGLIGSRDRPRYLFSHIVFQHMPKSIFWRYLREAETLLPKGAIFHAQMHRTAEPTEPPETDTLLVRGYTPKEIEANLDDGVWRVHSLLDVAGLSEPWAWLTLERL